MVGVEIPVAAAGVLELQWVLPSGGVVCRARLITSASTPRSEADPAPSQNHKRQPAMEEAGSPRTTTDGRRNPIERRPGAEPHGL